MLILYLILWIIFNERFTLEILWIGLLVSALIDLFTLKILGKGRRHRLLTWARLALGCVRYVVSLVREVFRCNMAVIRLILSPRLTVEPQLHYFRTRLKTDNAKVVLANSITLTPGTITCTLEDDTLCVHALDSTLGEGVENTEFEKKLLELEAMADES